MVLTGDCLAVLPTLEADSVDALVTDPPYGLAFMGKDWDHGVPGEPFWRAALRVAKPGAHLVAFGGTRTHHRLMVAIEDAGWEIRDCLMWLYGSGFPKSHNGAWGGTALKPAWEPIVLARKPLAGTVAANVARYGVGGLNVDGCRIGFSSPADESECKGKNQHTRYANPGSNRDSYSGNMPPRTDYTAPGRWPANVVLDEDAAARLDADAGGPSRFYFVSKKAQCEKLDPTVNAAAGRCDSCGTATAPSPVATSPAPGQSVVIPASTENSGNSTPTPTPVTSADSPDSIGTTPTTPSRCESCGCVSPATDGPTSPVDEGRVEAVNVQVSGTRFLYSAKAARSEREAGLTGAERPLLWSAGTLNPGSFQSENTHRAARNHHPTVKPIALMRWLCRLVTPPGGLILDPFTGSGSTGCAAALEGFRFQGIELSEDYAAIARQRIAHWTPDQGDLLAEAR